MIRPYKCSEIMLLTTFWQIIKGTKTKLGTNPITILKCLILLFEVTTSIVGLQRKKSLLESELFHFQLNAHTKADQLFPNLPKNYPNTPAAHHC